MRATAIAVLLALGLGALPAQADETQPRSECNRFDNAASKPTALAPRLSRLCVRLVDAHVSDEGMSAEETAAATLLGEYLAVVGELDLRKGAAGVGLAPGRPYAATTETARYLIAHRMGLLDTADRLAPKSAELR